MGVLERRWLIACSASLLNMLQVGTFFMAPTTLMPLILSEFDAEIALAPVPIAIGKLSYVVFLLPGGMFVDYYGPQRSLVLGFSVLAAAATVYALLLSDFAQTIFLHIVMSLAASVCGVPVYAVLVAQWFSEGLGTAMGLVLAGFSLSGVLTPVSLAAIAERWNWRTAMGIMAALLWFVALPMARWAVSENRRLSETLEGVDSDEDDIIPTAAQADLTNAPSPSQRPPWATQPFWMLLTCYVSLQYCFGSLAENMLLLFTIDSGLTLIQATSIFATLNMAAMTAKLVGGRLGDRYDRFWTAVAASSVIIVGLLMFFVGPTRGSHNSILTTSQVFFVLFAALFGLGYGATFNALYTFPPILFGNTSLGKVQSLLFGAGLCGNAVGAVVTGILRSNLGSYDVPFAILVGVAFVNVGVLLGLERTPMARAVRAKEEIPDFSSSGTATPFAGSISTSFSASSLIPQPRRGALRRSSTFADTLDTGLLGASLGYQTVDGSLWSWYGPRHQSQYGAVGRRGGVVRNESEPVLPRRVL